MLAVLAHDPDSGLIDYGSANVLQKDESAVILEFLDFYREGVYSGQSVPLIPL